MNINSEKVSKIREALGEAIADLEMVGRHPSDESAVRIGRAMSRLYNMRPALDQFLEDHTELEGSVGSEGVSREQRQTGIHFPVHLEESATRDGYYPKIVDADGSIVAVLQQPFDYGSDTCEFIAHAINAAGRREASRPLQLSEEEIRNRALEISEIHNLYMMEEKWRNASLNAIIHAIRDHYLSGSPVQEGATGSGDEWKLPTMEQRANEYKAIHQDANQGRGVPVAAQPSLATPVADAPLSPAAKSQAAPLTDAPAHKADKLYAVSEGTMEIMGRTIRTAVLNNGERVVLAEDAEPLLREILGEQ